MTHNPLENRELKLAEAFVQHTGNHVFLTGKAGTGKPTFLHKLKKNSEKRMIVTAPTGVAAINAGGVTLHSFFQLPFGPFIPGSEADEQSRRRLFRFSKEKKRIIKSLDLLVIDEISMVRADHSCGITDGDHILYGGTAAGYVVRLEGGYTFYHAGDTALFTDMQLIAELYRPELAFLPIGDLFTMGPDDSYEAIRLIKPTKVAPAHYNTWPPIEQDPNEWAERVRSETSAEPIVIQPGGKVTL